MKSPKLPFGVSVREMTWANREKAAKTVFGLETVRAAIITAAGGGFDRAAIIPQAPLDLRATDAARAAVKYLADCGLDTSWESYQVNGDGPPLTGFMLLVSWG